MKRVVVVAALIGTLALPSLARAGSSTDAALGLGAFAVFNQILSGTGIFGGGRPVVIERPVVVAPPPVVYAPPVPVYAPPAYGYAPPAPVYAPPPAVVYRTPPAVVYQAPPRVYAPPRYGYYAPVEKHGHWKRAKYGKRYYHYGD